jgi:hypothetical protein
MPNDLNAEEDLQGRTPEEWIVCGWFTPDYRPLAAKLAVNLDHHGAPYHLWAKPKSERGWNTWRKPSVVLEAMDAYPGKTVVLMDVDCRISGDIAPVTDIAGDVSLTLNARPVRLLWPPHKRIAVKAISRVVVFRPTEAARAFTSEWARLCESTHYEGDEAALRAAFLTCPGVAFSHLDPRYAGLGEATDAIVHHESAHAVRRLPTLGEMLRSIERQFRSGRTRAAKQAGLTSFSDKSSHWPVPQGVPEGDVQTRTHPRLDDTIQSDNSIKTRPRSTTAG